MPAEAASLAAIGIEPRLAALLSRRGVRNAAEARSFLAPDLSDLEPPEALPGLPEAVARLRRAVLEGERVAIVGDYDADGVTATAILVAALGSLGGVAAPILPHRLHEGYGFQPLHAERARALGCGLVLTVDCGLGSAEAVATARGLGLDVIVADHHLPSASPPAEALLVAPCTGGPETPGRELTGAGLAFKIAEGLTAACGREIPREALLRVACIGTIADVAPLVGENRRIAALGLRALGAARSPGLRALLESTGVRPPLQAEDVAFRLAPRLNAAGRLASAEPALELLLSRDPVRAAELAAELERLNQERQRHERRVLEEATAAVGGKEDTEGPLLVLWGRGWHPGVVGIAAGRLARELTRPVILLAADGDAATGSGRSVPGIDLHGFLLPWQGELRRFGGHAQAVGLTAGLEDLPRLRREWNTTAARWPSDLLRPRLAYELALAPEEVSDDFLAALGRLAPHGNGNPEPLLRIGPLNPTAPPRLFGKRHHLLRARGPGGGAELGLVAWGGAPEEVLGGASFEVLATARARPFFGPRELVLADARRMQKGGHDVESAP
ncbi:MAG TPA: single-stranded-DNA-specific exonuclease RecJ [Thermoanaerobaculia bacterium]|nr:single-stranded-DNA-specific exonuclease RecJ [Thermoanaerobaculia bacterium]